MPDSAAPAAIYLRGIPVSGGAAVSRVCLFNDRRHTPLAEPAPGEVSPPVELSRLQAAVARALQQLAELRRKVADGLGPAEAEIFSAQATILEDEALQAKIRAAVDAQTAAPQAVVRVLDEYESRLLELDNAYIRERASDIGEIKRRLLDILENTRPGLQCAGQPHCRKGRDRIIIAEELTPTLTTEVDARYVQGFVTERGGKTSHAAILARALGIPAVTGIKGIHGAVTCGTEVLVDGDTGEVVVNPPPAMVRAVSARRPRPAGAVPPVDGLRVLANISTAADAAAARAALAEGIGLYRTEFEFFAADRLLTEDEQFEKYSAVLRAMDGRPVTFRLLDLGGDKTAPFLNIQPEQNPALGFRGGRLLLARAELWRAQARALARAAAMGPVQVLYPMIVDLEQFQQLRAMFEDAVRGLPPARLQHGVMLEVPSACLQARELLAESDFASVGSNDLIQYLFAVDRNNELVSDDYRPERAAFWKLLGEITAAAGEFNRPLTICGELAGEPAYLQRLCETGVAAVSVSPRAIGLVRRAYAGA